LTFSGAPVQQFRLTSPRVRSAERAMSAPGILGLISRAVQTFEPENVQRAAELEERQQLTRSVGVVDLEPCAVGDVFDQAPALSG
jgi:hypothetical protein